MLKLLLSLTLLTALTSYAFSQKTPENILTKASSNLKEPSDAAKDIYNKGADYFSKKDYPAAIRSYEQAIAMEPDFIDAYNNLGLTFYEAEKYDSAFYYLQKSLSRLPAGTTALINTGLVEEKREHLSEALACYKKVVANDPENPEGPYNVARVMVTMGQLQESIPVAEQAEKLYAKQKSPVISECHLLQLIIYFNLKDKVKTKKYRDLCKKEGMDVPAELQGDPN